MPTGRDFTAEQWREIDAARSRLQAYKDKVQPYPVLPADEPVVPQEQVIVHRHSNMGKLEYDLLQQTARRAEHLEKKLNQRKKPQDYEPF